MIEKPDSFGCLANTIKVSAGHYVDLLNPDPSTIEIRSIAAALSKLCRFGGHSPRFYSVAEHCFHATVLAALSGYSGESLRAVFLHDAAEAYVGDMVRPLKVMIPAYAEFEHRIEQAIQTAFDVDFNKWREVIKGFDREMLKAEKVSLWPGDTTQWTGFNEISNAHVDFKYWDPEAAEIAFLGLADTLDIKGAK